jgi:hypothetical protein
MAENPTVAQELLQTTDLIDVQDTRDLLYQRRYGQEGLQAQTLHPSAETCTRVSYPCFRSPGLKELAKLDPGWTRGLTCPAA